MAGGFVGRANELAIVRAAIAAADGGEPGIVLLVGEAGIGKTRLADEAATSARGAGQRVVRGEADASFREPMELWRGVYRALGVEPPGDPSVAPAERRWEHLEALAGGLAGVAPAVVVLDDLHWADDLAVWVLERLPRALGDARVAFLATTRDHEPDMPRLDGLRRVSRVVRLPGLDVDAVRALADAQGGAADAAELHARTGGNPLFVRELLSGPGGGVIDEVMDRALERFDEGARALLALVAIAGPTAPIAVLADAAGRAANDVADALAPAVAGGVLSEVGADGVRFHHALLADAARRSAPAAPLHEQLARAWEATGHLAGRAAGATHRLGAASGAAAIAEAVVHALALADELTTADQHGRAAGVLREAATAALGCPDRPDVRARALLALAEVLEWLGDWEPAEAAYEEAAALARGLDDPPLRARAEIGAAAGVNPFLVDAERVHRLRGALEALPDGELRLRALLLGRLSIVAGVDPRAFPGAWTWADEALAVARETGDPLLVVQALLDRYIRPRDRSEYDARAEAGREIVALAERAGRGDLAIQGHQWIAADLLNNGDLEGASRALARAEVLAELQPSPLWRCSVMLRRTTLLALAGNHEDALAQLLASVRVGEGTMALMATLGFEIDQRHMLVDLFGGEDPAIAPLYATLAEMTGDIPAPALQMLLGHAGLRAGDQRRVDVVLRRIAPDPELMLMSVNGDLLLLLLGDVVATAGAVEHAAGVYDALLPFSGFLNAATGGTVREPADSVLARLALLLGDTDAARRHAEAAVAFCERLPSMPLLRRVREVLAPLLDGAAPAAPSPAAPARAASLARDGDGWVLASPLGEVRVADSAGVQQLARLLAHPSVELPAVELAGGPGGSTAPVAADLGPALDARAKRAYRARLTELQAELDDADAANDPGRSERAQLEIEALMQELERAVGLGGRDRPSGSGAERARVNVVRSIKRAIAAIEKGAPDLGRHLAVSVRTGRYCSYAPEPAAALDWTVTP